MVRERARESRIRNSAHLLGIWNGPDRSLRQGLSQPHGPRSRAVYLLGSPDGTVFEPLSAPKPIPRPPSPDALARSVCTRPARAIHGIPDPYPELRRPGPQCGKLVALPVLGGVQHDYRLVA
jgi:hypothetical protein